MEIHKVTFIMQLAFQNTFFHARCADVCDWLCYTLLISHALSLLVFAKMNVFISKYNLLLTMMYWERKKKKERLLLQLHPHGNKNGTS